MTAHPTADINSYKGLPTSQNNSYHPVVFVTTNVRISPTHHNNANHITLIKEQNIDVNMKNTDLKIIIFLKGQIIAYIGRIQPLYDLRRLVGRICWPRFR